MTSSETSVASIFLSASTIASTDPWVSALTTTLRVFACEASRVANKVLQRDFGPRLGGLGAGQFGALIGQVARGLLVLQDAEFQARFRHAVEAENA